jgi:hypothetical protein
MFQRESGPGAVPNAQNQPQIRKAVAYYHTTNQSTDMCQTPLLYQNQTLLHQINQQNI